MSIQDTMREIVGAADYLESATNMNKIMLLKEIMIVADYFDKLGMEKEADMMDGIMKKVAVDMEEIKCLNCGKVWNSSDTDFEEAKDTLRQRLRMACPSCENIDEDDKNSVGGFLRDIGEEDMAETYGNDEYEEAYSEKGDPDAIWSRKPV